MSETGVPYKRHSAKTRKFKVPPPPNIPAPNPEVPPPGGPIPTGPVPGEPSSGRQEQVFMCPVCGMTFTSREALQLHMANAHPGSTGSNR